MVKSKKIPCVFYFYLHSKLWEMTQGKWVHEKDLKKMLFQWKIPSNIRVLIIKELQLLGLVKKEKRYILSLKRPNFTEEKINKYYELLNIF